MCLICVEFEKDRLTIGEARRNLGEMAVSVGEEHASEVRAMLRKSEEAEIRQEMEDDFADPNYWESLYELADVHNWD